MTATPSKARDEHSDGRRGWDRADPTRLGLGLNAGALFAVASGALYSVAYEFWDGFYGSMGMSVEQAGGNQATVIIRMVLIGGFLMVSLLILTVAISFFASAVAGPVLEAAVTTRLAAKVVLPERPRRWISIRTRTLSADFTVEGGRPSAIVIAAAVLVGSVAFTFSTEGPSLVATSLILTGFLTLTALWVMRRRRRAALCLSLAFALGGILFAANTLGVQESRRLKHQGNVSAWGYLAGIRVSFVAMEQTTDVMHLKKADLVNNQHVLLAVQDDTYALLDLCTGRVVRVAVDAVVLQQIRSPGPPSLSTFCIPTG